MNDILTPPAERDLPPGRAARMRAEMLAATAEQNHSGRHHARRHHARRLALVAAVVTGIAAVTVVVASGHEPAQTLAMSTAEMTPAIRDAARDCLAEDQISTLDLTVADLTVGAVRGERIAVLFLNNRGYKACDFEATSTAVSGDTWPTEQWVPGHVQQLLLTSTGKDSGDVTMIGRVSTDVRRLVLEHGNGKRTTARLTAGVFGLLSEGAVTGAARLVAYDGAGTEIYRRPLFPVPGRPEQCWTDPAGRVVFGPPGAGCLPAEPWSRR